ncbi:LexA family transcriptional regulator [Bacillus licheniformis]|uniref:LexA family transcriptional regulator n=1 Tax=Bacillus licheniformis TaxID=1402 RepID=UPI000B8B19BC|nr:XRE family transcriptional regulator [Bacillus licheniformis]MED0689926.1 XRE family transcriptional regulator [Bacillus licheniformis]MED0713616.1 XRE family transcriptional regulator [Bacillus licheniformis]MED0789267.1 XRE family transcriptional regulator [Bacillus licheniformis]WIW99349.1 XRE family transcriptional regulator [Bacillus licheniformis]
MSVFSDKLSELMNRQKIGDTKLAEDLNVSRTTVLRWRTGERTPKLPKMKEVAEYFNVSPKVFVDNDLLDTTRPVSDRKAVPRYGSVKAGPDGPAYQEFHGFEHFEDITNPDDYFVLDVSGDSMTGDGIFSGDQVLIKKMPEVEYNGQIAVVVINGYEGTLKRVHINNGSITLYASNPKYPPRTFVGSECEDVRIVGVLKELKRKF